MDRNLGTYPPEPAPENPYTFFKGQRVLARIAGPQLGLPTPRWIPAVVCGFLEMPAPGHPWRMPYYSIDINTIHLPALRQHGFANFVGAVMEAELKPDGRAPARMLGNWRAIEHYTGWRPPRPPPKIIEHFYTP
jgi:hypothetical protein